jgi:hypothetical protein
MRIYSFGFCSSKCHVGSSTYSDLVVFRTMSGLEPPALVEKCIYALLDAVYLLL